jgi:uncharacterized membrane protein YgcG
MYQQNGKRYMLRIMVLILVSVMGIAVVANAAKKETSKTDIPDLSKVDLSKCSDCQLAAMGVKSLIAAGLSPEKAQQVGEQIILHFAYDGKEEGRAGARQALLDAGVPKEKVDALEKGMEPLIDQGMSSGAFERLAGMYEQGLAQQLGVPHERLGEVLFALDRKDEKELGKLGLTPDQITQLEIVKEHVGYDAAALDAIFEDRALMQSLEKSGIKDQKPFLEAYYNLGSDKFDDMLAKAGVDSKAFNKAFEQNYEQEYTTLGLSKEEMEQVQQEAFLEEVADRRDDPEGLQAYLEEMGFSEKDAEKFVEASEKDDPEAMQSILEKEGYDADKVEEFVQEQQQEESSATEETSGSSDSGSSDSGDSDSGSSDSGSSSSGSSDSGSSSSGGSSE